MKSFIMTTMTVLGLLSALGSNAAEPAGLGGFVKADGTNLTLNGGDFYFSGANSYSMLYSEADAQEQFEIAADLGLNVLRVWGFWNGEVLSAQVDEAGNQVRPATPQTDVYGHYVLQSNPGEYPEQGWRRLDYVLYLAHVYNIKLIIPLANEWPEFGGLETYMAWAGLETPERGFGYNYENAVKNIRDQFWASADVKQLYYNYVEHLLNRVNTYTGVAYKDDPAVMIWEIMNEPRFGPWGGDKTATVVRDWLADAAAFIKSIDQNHLVGTGEEGFLKRADTTLGLETYPWTAAPGEGVDFALNAQIDNIDVLGFHCWPFQWNLWGSSEQDFGEDQLGDYPDISEFAPQWIKEHVRIANEVGKPAYLGEFGFQILRRDGSDVSDRDLIMQKTYDAARQSDIAGVAFWHITSSHNTQSAVYDGPIERNTLLQSQYYDGIRPHDVDFRFDIFCPEDQTTCAIIEAYTDFQTARVNNPDGQYNPPCLPPRSACDDQCVLIESHPDHCGACFNACQASETCRAGVCTALVEQPQKDQTSTADNEGCTLLTTGNPTANLVSILLK